MVYLLLHLCIETFAKGELPHGKPVLCILSHPTFSVDCFYFLIGREMNGCYVKRFEFQKRLETTVIDLIYVGSTFM